MRQKTLKLWRYLRPFVGALILVIFLDLSIGLGPAHRTLDAWIENPVDLKFEEIAKPPSPDILFLGSSRTFHGLSVSTFSHAMSLPVTAYNFGLPATEYDYLSWVLDNIIRMHRKPKLLALEVSDFMLMDNFQTNSVYYSKLLSYHPHYFSVLFHDQQLSSIEKLKVLLSGVSAIYRYNTVLSPLMLMHLSENSTSDELKHGKMEDGWQPLESTRMVVNRHVWSLDNMGQFRMNRLRSILAQCQTQNIPVVLISWPDHPRYQERFERQMNGQSYQKMIDDLAQQYHVPILDLKVRPENGLPDRLFADLRHLNRQGAIFYSAELGQLLSSMITSNRILWMPAVHGSSTDFDDGCNILDGHQIILRPEKRPNQLNSSPPATAMVVSKSTLIHPVNDFHEEISAIYLGLRYEDQNPPFEPKLWFGFSGNYLDDTRPNLNTQKSDLATGKIGYYITSNRS